MAGLSFNMKVTGLSQIRGKVTKAAKKDWLNDPLEKLRMWLERTLKQATVVDTGEARGSVTSTRLVDSIQLGMSVHYAEYLEYGTSKMEARHMEGGQKVLGLGMFAYTLRKLQQYIGSFVKNADDAIEAEFR